MKKTFKQVGLLLAAAFLLQGVNAQNSISLKPDEAKVTIQPEIYGQFAEHLGRCVYEGIYVGSDSEIDNTNGYRTDVMMAMKDLEIPVLRWPGGCFADTYHWKDGVGPVQDRPSMLNIFWGGTVEDNSFGTHEFLDFCELIGTQPYLSLNVGSGTVQEAMEWIEYVTSDKETPMVQLRKKNGREKPWKVKYWGIGNESWGCGGDMRPEYYADLFRRYASYAKADGMFRIACGANSRDYNWTKVLMERTRDKQHLVQGISLHHYTLPTGSWRGSKGSSTNFEEDQWFSTMKGTMFMDELIGKHLEEMDKFDPRHRVGLMVDEWGTWYDVEPGTEPGFLYQQNTLRDALVASINLNIFNQRADRVKMANIAQVVNVLQAMILTQGANMILTPTYHTFMMYKVHMGATLIPLDITCDDYVLGEDKLPAISASASEKDGKINITLCNIDPNKGKTVTINLSDINIEEVEAQIITSENMNDFNDFGREEKVTLKEFKKVKAKKGQLFIEMPAKAVVGISLVKK